MADPILIVQNFNYYYSLSHCRFSRQLAPIFEAAEKELTDEEQLVFARVDCDKDGDICKEFMVNKVFKTGFFLEIYVFSIQQSNCSDMASHLKRNTEAKEA